MAGGSQRPPNIVLIECDSMDGRVMGCMDHPAAYTPNMDRLAERGVLFRNTYCNSPQCCPSRASRWSGRHTHEIEGWNNGKGISEGDPTYMTHLEDAGYRAGIYGKADYLSGGHSLRSKVCAWTRRAGIRLPQKPMPTAPRRLVQYEEERERVHTTDWEKADRGVAYMKEHAAAGRPFLLDCSFDIPHPSFISSATWLGRIDPDRVSLPPFEADLHPVMDYMSATKNCLHDFTEEEILRVRRTYFAMVAELDAMVGQVVQAVDDLGLADHTYIIFTSDHGEMNMEHRQYLKNALYEASARVPLIISGPGVARGEAFDDPVSLVDFYPTLMDLVGLPHPEGLSGRSLMPILAGGAEARPEGVLSQYHSNFSNAGIFMLRRGPWKYIAYPGYDAQLFNLERDPEEMEDLAASHPDVAGDMEARLRGMVDYEAVDATVNAYGRESFLRWRESLGEAGYREAMAGVYQDWDDGQEMKVEAWLKDGG